MKIKDLLYPSIDYLSKECPKLFKLNYSDDLVPLSNGLDFKWPEKDDFNLLLMGDAIWSFDFLKFCPMNSQISLWVLNSSFAKFISIFIGIPLKNIGVLPRGIFYKRDITQIPFPNMNDFFNVIICSRGKKSKNVDLTLDLLKYFKEKKVLNFKVHFYGPNFSFQNIDKLAISKGLEEISVFHGDKGIDWIQDIPRENPLFINLSTDYLDDFSVSTLQIENEGIPIITTDFGPYKEIIASNVICLDPNVIEKAINIKEFINRGEYLDKELEKLLTQDPKKHPAAEFTRPTPLERDHILDIIQEYKNSKSELKIKLYNDHSVNIDQKEHRELLKGSYL
jgi:hypothetical protein